MAFLPDDEARRVREMVRCPDEGERLLAQWTAKLLDDRAARSALIQRLARHLHRTRRRLLQAARYVDRLLDQAHDETRAPWPNKALCPYCGASSDQLTVGYCPNVQKQGDQHHVQIHRHVDGVECMGTERDVLRDGPRIRLGLRLAEQFSAERCELEQLPSDSPPYAAAIVWQAGMHAEWEVETRHKGFDTAIAAASYAAVDVAMLLLGDNHLTVATKRVAVPVPRANVTVRRLKDCSRAKTLLDDADFDVLDVPPEQFTGRSGLQRFERIGYRVVDATSRVLAASAPTDAPLESQ